MTTTPLAVLDTQAPDWPETLHRIGGYDRLCDWIRDHALNPNVIYRVEVYSPDDGTPFARVFELLLDDKGRAHCPLDHGHDGECDVARQEPYDVPLTSLPPGIDQP